jgi:transposase
LDTKHDWKIRDGFEIFGVRKGMNIMNQRTEPEAIVREIKRRTRKKYNSEEKIRIVLEGLRGEASISEVCRKEGINPNVYYKWSKEFLEAGKKRLEGNTEREATSTEVMDLRKENEQLKALVAELSLKNRVLKKSSSGLGSGSDVE